MPNKKNSLINANVDAIALLGHATASLSSLRRASLKSALKPEYQALCSNNESEPHTPLLFGEDFGKMVKDLDESRKIGRAFKGNNNQRPQQSFRRDNTFHPYQRYQRASQQRSQNNFLWKGPPQPPSRRKNQNQYFSRRPQAKPHQQSAAKPDKQ